MEITVSSRYASLKASQTFSLHCAFLKVCTYIRIIKTTTKDHYGLNQLLPLSFHTSMKHMNNTQTLAEEKQLLQLS